MSINDANSQNSQFNKNKDVKKKEKKEEERKLGTQKSQFTTCHMISCDKICRFFSVLSIARQKTKKPCSFVTLFSFGRELRFKSLVFHL